MDWQQILKKWWVSVLLIPFIVYQLHQAYWTLNFNIFFSISYSFPFPVNVEKFLVSNFLLIVHEAGHTFFSIFGSRIITILGGSLNEILLPLLIVIFTIFNRYIKGTQFALYLLGSAWFSVAFYAADGGQRQLPLIGNLGKESHDWYNLLRHYNILEADASFALTFVIIGSLVYIAALTVPVWLERVDNIDLDLDL
ncbi:hypothetical protein [Rhodohalobacter sp. 614A]|uniref:hypothetical protein n=1 Tax=Rhodohalobacter sp. 614A TaxID=2908649 RepID=UPI001F25FCF1|nr:hypothetical protein [Rhodohalobacter sp. 614A]